MEKLTKGAITRQMIVTRARKVLNEHGISLTLNELATKMDVTIGRITNHFPTKEHLFIALSDDYEAHFAELVKSFSWNGGVSLTSLAAFLRQVMKLQFEHRCLLLYVCATSLNQRLMLSQVSMKWNNNLEKFTELLENLVRADIVKKSVLGKENYEVLKFQHITLLTTWLVSLTIYDKRRPLKKSMDIYLKGILMTFLPFLSKKGLAELNKVTGLKV